MRDDQVRRYARHILLPELGGRGQERLLAAAGVGRIAVTGDAGGALEPGEAASGILYGSADVGRPRIDAIRARIGALNPDVVVLAEAPPDAIALAVDPGHGEVGDEDEVADALVRGGGAASQLLRAIASGAPA